MKIKHLATYKSITPFTEIEVPDLTILTGVNGSGKTHLLEGIIAKNIELSIEGKKINSIAHFNYQNFIVNIKDNQDIRNSNKKNYSDNIRKIENKEQINKEINNIQGKIIKIIDSFLLLNQERMDFKNDIFEIFFLNTINLLEQPSKQEIEKVIDQRREYLDTYPERMQQDTSLNDQDVEDIYKNCLSIIEIIKEKLSNDNLFKKYNNLSKQIKIPLLSLNASHCTLATSYLGMELLSEIKTYLKERANNDLLRSEAERQGGKAIQNFSNESFIKKKGIPPWEFMNGILKEYSCNNYLLNKDFSATNIVATDITKWKPPLHLIDFKTNITVPFEGLSSGEKILLGLALMIYKEKRKKGLPEVLLLDEIDSNLHPSMIRQLLEALQNIFIKNREMRIILVTHSPTTIALAPEDSVYIMNHKNEEAQRIEHKTQNEALEILTEGYATLKNGLKLLDQIYQKEINIFSEGNNIEYLKKANNFFGDPNKTDIINIKDRSGKDQLETYYDLFCRVSHTTKVFFVWDCDIKDKVKNRLEKESKNNTFPFVFDYIDENRGRKGIEALFSKALFTEEFYDHKEDVAYGESRIQFNKARFQEHMIKNGTKDDFKNFKQLFDYIDKKTSK